MTTERTGQTTNFSNQGTEYTVSSYNTNSPSYTGEVEYNPRFNHWNKYYRRIPELRAVINKLASWTFGKGIIADDKNQRKLDRIRGNGKDSPRGVLKNLWRVALTCGDGFGHIITDEQGRIKNVKPLNAQRVTIVASDEGIISHYLYDIEINEKKRYEADEILHLSYERMGDEINGIPFIEALEDTIISRNEALSDLRILYHRNIKPINWIEVETDDKTKLNAIEDTINDAYKKTENIVISTGVIKEIKKQQTSQYATLDSLPFLKFLVRQFVTSCGVPEVIMGWGADTTEANSKIVYLAFQQEIEDMQNYIQEQIKRQLNIDIELEFPQSIVDDLKKDEKKDANYQVKARVGKAGKDTK